MNMKKTNKIVISLPFMVLLALMPFFNVRAADVNDPLNKYDSMYRYNALENKVSFYKFINNEVLFPDLGYVIEKVGEKSLKISELSENLTKELQAITEKQNFSLEQLDKAMNVLKDRNEFKTFLMGSDLGIFRFQLIQIKNQTSLLYAFAIKDQEGINKIQIDDQIKLSKEEQMKVESLIREEEDKFSLFGWCVKIF